MKTKILVISMLSFLIKTAIAQPVSTPYSTGIRLSDDFSTNTWATGVDNDGGDIIADDGPNGGSNMLQFLSSTSNGNVQYRQKLIPGLPSPFTYLTGMDADLHWRIQFDYNPINYSGAGTSHVLMALADNTVSPTKPPMTTALSNSTVSITPTNIVGVMLISDQGQPASSNLVLFAKRTRTNPITNQLETIIYTSDGIITALGLNITNIQTVTHPNTSSMAIGTNGLAVPIPLGNAQNYRIVLERIPKINSGVYLQLMQNINGVWTSLGRIHLALPDDALIANATATSPILNRFICSNLPQGGNRVLDANIDNLQISRRKTPSITASVGNGISYCQSIFPTAGVNFTAPQISQSVSNWAFSNGGYTVGVPVNIAKLHPTFPLVPNGTSGNAVYFPYSHAFTFLPGNTLVNFFTTTENQSVAINTNCRVNYVNDDGIEQMSLFPNPASNKLMLSGLTDLGIIHSTEILNMNGQTVQKTAIEAEQSELELNVAELPVGVYILKVDTENGQKVEKFIKE